MPDQLPLALRLYQFASSAAAPVAAPRLLARRLDRGKEHPERFAERRGEASQPRPAGPLVWLHGASVGEMLAAVPLIERIRNFGFAVLVTSGTVTSAALAEQRLPDGTLHQFIPLDAPPYVTRFLNHWKPDLALFVESDLWPNLILAAARQHVPMVMINGRLSERSFRRWRMLPRVIGALLSRFDMCLAQSVADAERYAELGAPSVRTTGNLKLDSPPPPVDDANLEKLKGAIGDRAVIAAASTHPGEETIVIAAHRRLREKNPSLLTIIAPRHPERGESIAEIARVAGLNAGLRSRDDKLNKDTDIYVADTLGELGLIYRLAPIVFMGGSLVSHGGQNPIEAVRLGAAVLHGPHVSNFSEIYSTLDEAKGAKPVSDEETLLSELSSWLPDPVARRAVAEAGSNAVGQLGGALERTLEALNPYLMQLRLEQERASS